jgi:hypothetical protein
VQKLEALREAAVGVGRNWRVYGRLHVAAKITRCGKLGFGELEFWDIGVGVGVGCEIRFPLLCVEFITLWTVWMNLEREGKMAETARRYLRVLVTGLMRQLKMSLKVLKL